ncbi:MAG TPA: flavin reductase family protein [Gemmatimonadales bacterium]|jgi:flavin reductase (DIM6/NTAB) family NADH-FMN oxidoreductase RutF|nr:flavin reductase family protein [Gemmatimonadales bacterium]
MVSPDDTYQLLRNLTSPVVAITCEHGGKRNGMILDSAIRASIVPTIPRVAMFIHKFNTSHDLIFASGRLGLHLLQRDQFELIHQLGFFHGTDKEKLADIPHHVGLSGVPVLDQCYAHFECRVVNAMDTGSSTCFLCDVEAVGFGASEALAAGAEVMTAAYFRANIPAAWRDDYVRLLGEAQEFARERSRDIRAVTWPGVQ